MGYRGTTKKRTEFDNRTGCWITRWRTIDEERVEAEHIELSTTVPQWKPEDEGKLWPAST